MKASTVQTFKIVGVLALSLIAVLAIVMFFSFSRSGPEQAQAASQSTVVAMEIRAPATAALGAKFDIEVWGNLTPPDPISAF
ncbi:MAG: hypothetical protein IIC26_05460, partial [Chloroflexi bacterium]|nr:hypothetical protein [Chloroflexota bacterium]